MSRRHRRYACRFSRRRDYTMPVSRSPKKPSLPLPPPPERRRFRQRLLAWYRRHGRDLPWRKTERPVPHPRVRDHAAADPGRPRAAEIPRMVGEVPVARRLGGGARAGSHRYLVSARLQHPAEAPADHRPRIGRRTTAARCRPTRRRCVRSRESARTRRARSGASPSASARRFWIRTSPASCSGSSSAPAIRRATRRNAICGRSPRRWCQPATSSISIRR